ncbi:MAG: LPS export ABC transporter permease LptG [Thermoanaerobaculaceae bacterium]|nr:LPS export ABC transporter permease LptG [Thermoanaerobaculaceae bacterium]
MSRRPRRFVVARSLVREMLPTLLLAAGVTTFLLLIRALFVLADLFIARNVELGTVVRLLLLGVPNILALTLPIGTLFAVLMTAARWAADSELIAMQACGVPLRRVARPLVALAVLVFAGDVALTVAIMPAANAQLSGLTRKIAFSAANAAVEQKVFAEDFPGQLLYVDKIDRGTGRWHGILLFDTSNPTQESLVTADSGDLAIDPHDGSAWLNLQDTTTHLLRPDEPDSYRKNDNNELRIRLRQAPVGSGQTTQLGVRETSTRALLDRVRRAGGADTDQAREALVELNKRVAIPAAAIVFALVGFPLGIRNRRGGKGFGLTASVGLVVAYYVLLNNGELFATSGKIPVGVGMWLPNLVLLLVAAALFHRASRGAAGGGGGSTLAAFSTTAAALAGAPFRLAGAALRRLWFGKRDEAAGAADAAPVRVPGTLGIVDRYLLRQCLSFFALVVVAVCALWVAVDLSGNLEDIRRHAVPLVTVASYYLFSIPQILHDTLPLAFLIAFLATATMLERRNETTAFKAAGISLSRVALPLLLLGAASGVGLFFLDDHVTQRAERSKQQLEDVLRGRKVARSYRATDRPYVFLPDGRTLVNFLEFDPDTNTLIRPSVFVFDQRFNLRTRYMAKRATFVNGKWRAEGAWSRTFMADATPEFVSYPGPVDLPLSVRPDYFGREYRRPEQMSFGELRRYISTLRAAGYRVDRLVVQLNQKVAYPFSLVLLAWLALPFAFRPGRSRSAIGGIALALVLGMAYFGLTALVTQLGEAALVPPALASWTPTVVFALLAVNRHTTLRT